MPDEESKKIITKKHLARLERERIQRRYLITGVSIALVLVVGLIIFGILDQLFFQDMRTVATIGNDKITQGEYQARVRYARWQLVEQYKRTLQMADMFGGLSSENGNYFQNSLQQIQSQLDNASILGQGVLEAMVDERVIEQEAVKQGVVVTDEEIDHALQEAFGFYANGTPTPAATRVMLPTSTLSAAQLAIVTLTPTATLAPTATKAPTATAPAVTATATQEVTPYPTATAYTLEGYQNQYKDYVSKVTAINFKEADWRRAFKASVLRDKLTKKINAEVPTKEDQVWARHILVKDEETAKTVLERLKKGEAWDSLAKELSTDESNKNSGGDLGWFTKDKMVAEFSTAAFALKIGEISQPVKSSFGYHIIQSLGHEERELSQADYAAKQNKAFDDWLTKAKDTLGVKTNDISGVTPTEPVLDLTAE